MKYIEKYGFVILLGFVFFMFYKPILLFLLGGIFIMSYSLYYLFFLNSINRIGKETIGIISSYQIDDEGYKTPLIEYEIDGKQILKEPYFYSSTDLSKFKTYKSNINKSIPIVYIPKEPQKFIIKTETGFNYFSLIFAMIVGMVFISISLAHLLNFIKITGM